MTQQNTQGILNSLKLKTDLGRDMIQSLKLEAQKEHTSKAYKELFYRLIDFTLHKEKEQLVRLSRQKYIVANFERASQHVQLAKDSYQKLAELYKQEHQRFLELSERSYSLDSYQNLVTELQDALAVTLQETQVIQKDLDVYKTQALVKAKAEGLARREQEEVLLTKDAQIDVLEKKLKELTAAFQQSKEQLKNHNTEAAMLQLTLMQNQRYRKRP
ncbi:hypothetical protein BY458DRAFT_509862 [Sporodiniella umbellata]|nr:hypothetical protein BY458DRAFT_509862 [Sporodiniella umbellata]